jgi:hypothetical protein
MYGTKKNVRKEAGIEVGGEGGPRTVDQNSTPHVSPLNTTGPVTVRPDPGEVMGGPLCSRPLRCGPPDVGRYDVGRCT